MRQVLAVKEIELMPPSRPEGATQEREEAKADRQSRLELPKAHLDLKDHPHLLPVVLAYQHKIPIFVADPDAFNSQCDFRKAYVEAVSRNTPVPHSKEVDVSAVVKLAEYFRDRRSDEVNDYDAQWEHSSWNALMIARTVKKHELDPSSLSISIALANKVDLTDFISSIEPNKKSAVVKGLKDFYGWLKLRINNFANPMDQLDQSLSSNPVNN